MKSPKHRDNAKYRIYTKDHRVKFAGTGEDSWFSLEKARELVDYSEQEMIYEMDKDGNKLWEVF